MRRRAELEQLPSTTPEEHNDRLLRDLQQGAPELNRKLEEAELLLEDNQELVQVLLRVVVSSSSGPDLRTERLSRRRVVDLPPTEYTRIGS